MPEPRGRTPQLGGLKWGELGAKKPQDDPKPPAGQILGQIGPGKAEKRRLEQMSIEANPATWALLVPAAAAWGGAFLSIRPAVVGTPQGPWRYPQTALVPNFSIKK